MTHSAYGVFNTGRVRFIDSELINAPITMEWRKLIIEPIVYHNGFFFKPKDYDTNALTHFSTNHSVEKIDSLRKQKWVSGTFDLLSIGSFLLNAMPVFKNNNMTAASVLAINLLPLDLANVLAPEEFVPVGHIRFPFLALVDTIDESKFEKIDVNEIKEIDDIQADLIRRSLQDIANIADIAKTNREVLKTRMEMYSPENAIDTDKFVITPKARKVFKDLDPIEQIIGSAVIIIKDAKFYLDAKFSEDDLRIGGFDLPTIQQELSVGYFLGGQLSKEIALSALGKVFKSFLRIPAAFMISFPDIVTHKVTANGYSGNLVVLQVINFDAVDMKRFKATSGSDKLPEPDLSDFTELPNNHPILNTLLDKARERKWPSHYWVVINSMETCNKFFAS